MNGGEVGRLIRLEMVALGNAVVNLENGRLDQDEREELASGLDQLTAALRKQEKTPTVVEVERG